MEYMSNKLGEWEKEVKDEDNTSHNRVFYLAIPPQVLVDYASAVKKKGVADNGFTRLIKILK
jgi:glucose-6-phosphate 1-dehydrogenase